MHLGILEFTVAGLKRTQGSMFEHKWYIGCDNQIISNELAAKKIDEYLKVLNDDYRVERLDAIKEISVEILPPEIFYNWMRSQGKEGSQNKFPRVLRGEKYNLWVEFLSQQKR
jgi:hypothetical protein